MIKFSIVFLLLSSLYELNLADKFSPKLVKQNSNTSIIPISFKSLTSCRIISATDLNHFVYRKPYEDARLNRVDLDSRDRSNISVRFQAFSYDGSKLLYKDQAFSEWKLKPYYRNKSHNQTDTFFIMNSHQAELIQRDFDGRLLIEPIIHKAIEFLCVSDFIKNDKNRNVHVGVRTWKSVHFVLSPDPGQEEFRRCLWKIIKAPKTDAFILVNDGYNYALYHSKNLISTPIEKIQTQPQKEYLWHINCAFYYGKCARELFNKPIKILNA